MDTSFEVLRLYLRALATWALLSHKCVITKFLKRAFDVQRAKSGSTSILCNNEILKRTIFLSSRITTNLLVQWKLLTPHEAFTSEQGQLFQ